MKNLLLRVGVYGGMALLSMVTVGCRAPWQSFRSSEPNFDDLIEIERISNARDAGSADVGPAGRDSRDDDVHTLDAEGRLISNRRPEAEHDEDSLSSDRQYQEHYADVPPENRALLDKLHAGFRKSQRKAPGNQIASDTTRSTTAEGTELGDAPRRPQKTGDTGRGTTMHLSDLNEIDIEAGPDQLLAQTAQPTPTGSDQLRSEQPDRTSESADAVQLASHAQPFEQDHRHTPRTDDGVAFAFGESESGNSEINEADIRELGHAIIHKLEQAHTAATSPDERIDLAKKRRLANLILDDIEAAQDPIQELQPDAADYVRNTFQGLYDATDISGNPVASRRLTLALHSHRKAAEHLSKLANLNVRNLAFCTEVDSFGVVTKFPNYHFHLDQEVLLYCELENFVSEKVRGGYETQLQGSYEILDANGRRVADQLLPEDSDICGNIRKDFYIAYRLHLPADIDPGSYQLKLTIEDMKGRKFGQSIVDFKVVH